MNSPEDLLRENRPTLSALELDRVKQRARAQANRKTDVYGWKGIPIMRLRLVATSLLVAGVFFTGSGASLAVISDSQSAGVAQYPGATVPTPTNTTSSPGNNLVLGQKFSGSTPTTTPKTTPTTPTGMNEVLGAHTNGTSNAGSAPAQLVAPATVQATRQLGTNGGGNQLPFTGFAAIPVLLIGILMLLSGVALRRTLRRDHA